MPVLRCPLCGCEALDFSQPKTLAAPQSVDKSDAEVVISPDGKYIVTSKAQTPSEAPVLRINLAEGTERYVPVPDIKLLMGMDWAADGKSMWVGGYMGRSAGGARSGLLNVSLNGAVKVALRGLNPGVLWAIPSPDGRRLALLGNTTDSSNVWLLENF
jgi:hypothetical protein